MISGRKDAFPGADGSTIQQGVEGVNPNAESIAIYDANGRVLTEGSSGVSYVNITQSGVLSGNTSMVYTVKHPLSYIHTSTRPYDWYTDNESYQHNFLWGDKISKSESDPCPRNWKTPIKGTWYDLSSTLVTCNTQGLLYNAMSWYPSCGARLFGSGKLGFVESYGYNWSATVDNTIFVYGLGHSIAGAGLNLAHYRAYGFSVRCIQE